jgi:hypothetical protein
MHARTAYAVADDEVIFAIIENRRRGDGFCFLSVGTWSSQALVRSQEGCLAHAVLPNQNVNPDYRRAGVSESESRPIRSKAGLIYSGKVPK